MILYVYSLILDADFRARINGPVDCNGKEMPTIVASTEKYTVKGCYETEECLQDLFPEWNESITFWKKKLGITDSVYHIERIDVDLMKVLTEDDKSQLSLELLKRNTVTLV